eukprot:CAMPEP_0114980020 /NCGR_PEP_ID=MMETSP0216-20121206/4719_1 /TAXON_ID=223996 /ORGANISM="Protocruzia adherens, Strain Boccale" /LENGTH=228 /DNA_ID=CAMNT_0002341459 /DNA_START=42 /DNA_END=728 /DNA_ORIENTATION=+
MRKNPLLIKNEVGHSKKSHYALPEEGFTFGRPEKKDPEGVAEVTRSWKPHQVSKPKVAKRDFQKLNKMTVQAGVTSAKATNEFRKGHDARIHKYDAKPKAKGTYSEETRFGKIVERPKSPINGIINGAYAEKAELEARERKSKIREEKKSKRIDPTAVKYTTVAKKAIDTAQKKKTEGDGAKPVFKMKKFQNVVPRTQIGGKTSQAQSVHENAGVEGHEEYKEGEECV